MNETNYIARNIRAIRVHYGLSQDKFAALAKASQGSVSAWERGTAIPRNSAVSKIVDALPGLTPDDILSEERGFAKERSSESRTTDASDPVKSKLDAAYELMNDETREMIAGLAASIICDPKRRR